ncbi:hypothetical protein BDZ45DRAFT_165647 [Acephala macrosclerotiorum]|nr:hypothetical protein BDZ45DRAFT_165647 [Acephala macrosclerotiorum]
MLRDTASLISPDASSFFSKMEVAFLGTSSVFPKLSILFSNPPYFNIPLPPSSGSASSTSPLTWVVEMVKSPSELTVSSMILIIMPNFLIQRKDIMHDREQTSLHIVIQHQLDHAYLHVRAKTTSRITQDMQFVHLRCQI